MDPGLAADVARRAREGGLLAPGTAVLVAVSGGADSAALAGLLVEAADHGLPLRVVLAHLDHGWRGPCEAAADRDTVDRLARRLGVPWVGAGPPDVVRRTEDDARRFRYRALAGIARAQGCPVVATGHHLRDQAETFLLRLARGSGPAGLAGIPPRRPLGDAGSPPLAVVRPLLWVAPERLRAYGRARGLPWREDPTNAAADRDRTRVRARLEALGARGAAWTRDLAHAADRARGLLARRTAAVEAGLTPTLRHHVEARVVEVDLQAARAVVAQETSTLLRCLGAPLAADAAGPWFTRRHAALAHALLHGTGEGTCVALPHGVDLVRSGPRLLLAHRAVTALPTLALPVRDGASAAAGAVRARLALRPRADVDLDAWRHARGSAPSDAPWEALLDATALGASLTLRGVEPADAFVPWGRDAPTGVLSFLAKAGWPARLRRGARVAIAADGRVAWVLGHRIDARFAVTPTTAAVAALTVDVVAPSGLARP